jgi:hypothetical protein
LIGKSHIFSSIRDYGGESLAKEIRRVAGEDFTHQSAMALMKKWYSASQAETGSTAWDDDDAFVAWKDNPENYKSYVQELKAQKVSQSLSDLAGSCSDLQAFSQGLATLLDKVLIFPFYILTFGATTGPICYCHSLYMNSYFGCILLESLYIYIHIIMIVCYKFMILIPKLCVQPLPSSHVLLWILVQMDASQRAQFVHEVKKVIG